MKKERLTKQIVIRIIVLVVLTVLIEFFVVAFGGTTFSDDSFQNYYINITDTKNLEVYSEDESIVSVDEYDVINGKFTLTVEGHEKGHTLVVVKERGSEDAYFYVPYQVGIFGKVFNANNGCFQNYKVFMWVMIVALFAFAVILWKAYVDWHATARYSYQEIFYLGFALWVLVITLMLGISTATGGLINNMISTLQQSGGLFMTVTIPAVLIFAVALSISNISLIRHEGFRRNNALGIMISLLMVGGEVIYYAATFYFFGSAMQMHIHNVIISSYTSVFVLFECFLIGSIVSGIRSSKHKPKYDIDYIIILGCAIRKDGTLFPLIRGRVDKAIEFYKAQFEATGKKAIFVPSGGQGRNEVISEGEAMKRYLLEQGIPKEQIMEETKSRNTAENMRFSKNLIEEQNKNAKVAFSTTNYHVFRSGIISRQVGFAPEGMGAKTKWYFWPNAAVREIIGMVVYMWKVLLLILVILVLLFGAIEPFVL